MLFFFIGRNCLLSYSRFLSDYNDEIAYIPKSKASVFVIHGKFHQISLDETVNLTVHHTVHIRCLPVGTVVFHTTVVKNVAAYLAAPLYLLLAGFYLGLRLETLFMARS